MVSGVVTIGRRHYASGLYWENSPSGRVSQAAKEAARQPGHMAELFALRSGGKNGRIPQFALSQNAPEHKAGMPSLAGCLANQQPGSWAGAFTLREGTAVVVVRDDLIVPDGDLFFLDESEARDRVLQEMALGGLQRVYAPEVWGIPGADTMPISLLVNDRADVRLSSVVMSRSMVAAVAAGGALLLILLGVGWYINEENAQEEAARQAQIAALERLKMSTQNAVPGLQAAPVYPPPERKWEKRPAPMSVVEACHVALGQLAYAVAGWQLSGVRCDGTSLVTNWMRSGGFTAALPNAVINETGSNATLIIPLPALTPRGAEDLVAPEVVTQRYLSQNWPGSLNRAADDPLPMPPPEYTGTDWHPPAPPWVKRSFTVAVPQLPWILPSFFSDLPGVVVTSLILSGAGSVHQTWTIEGVIYETRR